MHALRRKNLWGWNPTGRRRWTIVLLLAGHALWILMGREGGMGWQRTLDALSRPSQYVSSTWIQWRQNRGTRIQDLEKANEELQRLRADNATLRLLAMKHASRIEEAEEALRLLGLKAQLPIAFKPARIIANVRTAPFGGMVLDQGRNAGFQPDQGVICPEGVVGRLWAVAEGQSSVLPLDAYNASTAVMLAGSRATGVLQGVEPGQAEVRYIGSQEVVRVGEAVFTSGLDGVFPRGMLVGYVSASEPGDVELRVSVTLSAPLDRLSLVMVLPPKPQLQVAPAPSAPAAANGVGGVK